MDDRDGRCWRKLGQELFRHSHVYSSLRWTWARRVGRRDCVSLLLNGHLKIKNCTASTCCCSSHFVVGQEVVGGCVCVCVCVCVRVCVCVCVCVCVFVWSDESWWSCESDFFSFFFSFNVSFTCSGADFKKNKKHITVSLNTEKSETVQSVSTVSQQCRLWPDYRIYLSPETLYILCKWYAPQTSLEKKKKKNFTQRPCLAELEGKKKNRFFFHSMQINVGTPLFRSIRDVQRQITMHSISWGVRRNGSPPLSTFGIHLEPGCKSHGQIFHFHAAENVQKEAIVLLLLLTLFFSFYF